MARQPGIRWGAVTVGALASEAIMLVLAIVFRQQQYGEQAVTDLALIGSFVLPLLFAIWAGGRAQSRFVLQGVLIGIFGILIYEALILAAALAGQHAEIPFIYYVAHGLKVAGGALGGVIAARRAPAPPQMGSGVI